MMKTKTQLLIPELGHMTFKTVTLGVLADAEDIFGNKDHDAFVNYLLANMIAAPVVTPQEIKNLSESAIKAMIRVAVKELDICDEFDSLPTDLSVRERLYQALYANFANTFQNITKGIFNISVVIPGWDELRKEAQKVLDTLERDTEELVPLLDKANFWLTPYLPMSIVGQLKEVAKKEDVTHKAVEQVFVDHYEGENWTNLKKMVTSWQNKPQFTNRMPIVLDALEAHLNGKYTLSVPALLTQVEGVASDILGQNVSRKTGKKIGKLIKDNLPERFRQAHKDLLFSFVTEMIFCYVDFDNFLDDLKTKKGFIEEDFLNRHTILHGVQTDYAYKEHSLRAFLLLDALNHISKPRKLS